LHLKRFCGASLQLLRLCLLLLLLLLLPLLLR
jgi:hypothetical protein